MKTFMDFIKEANDLDARNHAVDIEKIVRNKAELWNEKPTSDIKEDDIKKIVEYLKKSKSFSLAKMDDNFGTAKVSTGFLKSVIEVVKAAINDAGVGKSGSQSRPQSQADRIDSYLKQKHIGPIKR